MPENKYMIYCGFCGNKEIADNLDKYVVVEGCQPCHGTKVKCEKCGREVKVDKV